MATLVRGDKIKDGSIPLSALTDDTLNSIKEIPLFEDFVWNNIGEMPVFNREEVKALKQFLIQNHDKFIQIKFTDGESYINEIFFVSCYDVTDIDISGILQGNKYCYTIESMDDNLITHVFPVVSVPVPDWNAQEGEAGYIKNKPVQYLGTNKWYPYNNKYRIDVPKEWISQGYDTIYFIDTENNENDGCLLVDWTDDIEMSKFSGIMYIDTDGTYYLVATNIPLSIDYLKHVYLYYEENNIQNIDSEYFNTVIKTTPQTLSDNDKNQALTNLGIDPVVWKYICNPIILKNDDHIPLELIDVNTATFKYKIPGIYKVRIDNQNTSDFNIYNCTHYYEDEGLYAYIGTEQYYQIYIIENSEWDNEMPENYKYTVKVYNDI